MDVQTMVPGDEFQATFARWRVLVDGYPVNMLSEGDGCPVTGAWAHYVNGARS